jgi:hypothetical protein
MRCSQVARVEQPRNECFLRQVFRLMDIPRQMDQKTIHGLVMSVDKLGARSGPTGAHFVLQALLLIVGHTIPADCSLGLPVPAFFLLDAFGQRSVGAKAALPKLLLEGVLLLTGK